jgi:hypothetical protein
MPPRDEPYTPPHAARSEARWHGSGQVPGHRACGRDKPNVGLPSYPNRASARSYGASTVHSATSTVPRRQGRTAAIRRAISSTTCCDAGARLPMARRVNSASGPRCSRGRAAHAATRGSIGIRWYQPTGAGHLWPNNRPMAYLARSKQRLQDLLGHVGRRGDLIDREVRISLPHVDVRVGISCLARGLDAPRGRAAHAGACGRDKPNVGLPPYSSRVSTRPRSVSTVPSATPTALAICRAVRAGPPRPGWPVSITSCRRAEMWAVGFPSVGRLPGTVCLGSSFPHSQRSGHVG